MPSKASRGVRAKRASCCAKARRGHETVSHSFRNQERSLCDLPSRVTPTQGYRKQGGPAKPCCNTPSVRLITCTDEGPPEEESLERGWACRDSDSDSSDSEVFLEGWDALWENSKSDRSQSRLPREFAGTVSFPSNLTPTYVNLVLPYHITMTDSLTAFS